MKKIVLICSTVLLGLSLAGCGAKEQKKAMDTQPLYSVNVKKDDGNYVAGEWMFSANKNGNYDLQLKANKSGQITVTSDGDPDTTFTSKTYNVHKGDIVNVPLTVKSDKNTPGAEFYVKAKGTKTTRVFLGNPNYVEQSSSSEESSTNSTNTASIVESMLKPLIGKDNIKSIKIMGFTNTDIAGGSVIIATNTASNLIESKTINSIIADVCQKLNSNPSVTGTGITIKIISPDLANNHNIMTGHANIESKNFGKINANNVQKYANYYTNKGNQSNERR